MKTYNKKEFLLPNGEWSMAAFHAKIHEDGIASLRISDCNRTIKLWNDFNNPMEALEMYNKLLALNKGIVDFAEFIKENFIEKQDENN